MDCALGMVGALNWIIEDDHDAVAGEAIQCALVTKDQLSQALVVATVQAAKVMGIHCAAKRVESQAALQWLTAIGCDFAQGAALSPAQPLEALANAPDPTTRVAALRST